MHPSFDTHVNLPDADPGFIVLRDGAPGPGNPLSELWPAMEELSISCLGIPSFSGPFVLK